MSLFGKSQPQSQSQLNAEVKYRLAMQQLQQQQQQAYIMGHPYYGSGLGYGPAGMMQRSGLSMPLASMPTPNALLPEEVVVHALTGWRRWSVTMFGEELLSNNGTAWVPYQKLTATCPLGHSCHGRLCHCGIYAYKVRERAEIGENAPTELTHIWGEVSLWGRVIEHELGYRAQFAYPKSIINTGGIAARLAFVYGAKLIS